MAGEFGAYIDNKRKGRGIGGEDIKLKDIAEAMGMLPENILCVMILANAPITVNPRPESAV